MNPRRALGAAGLVSAACAAGFLVALLLDLPAVAMAVPFAAVAAAWIASRSAPPAAPAGPSPARVADLEASLERARKELEASSAVARERDRLLGAQEIARLGDWEWIPADDRFTASPELHRIHGLKPGEFPGTLAGWLERLHPSERTPVRAELEGAAQAGREFTHEARILRPDGESRDLLLWGRPRRGADGTVTGLAGAAQDITEVRRTERELAARARDLERSNADLEHFAYAASHDLQEPLRMVASYVQLLARRYRGKLDRDADEFIAFAVDGAERMQKLIRDLLTYSRVTRLSKPGEPVDLGQTLRAAMANLKVAIEDSGACITAGMLPTVKGDATGLTALVQNLLANAIKFRGPRPPTITLGAERRGDEWLFSVRDDGIGFDPKHAERIFIIFQRLNTSEKVEGSGIGLAICRKIVERHGGRIWAESVPGVGSAFHFTLPAAEPAAAPPRAAQAPVGS